MYTTGVDVTRENNEDSSLYLGFSGANDKSSDDNSTEREITGALASYYILVL